MRQRGTSHARARRHAPATARNRTPILEVLRGLLPARGTVLETASGTGEHIAWLAGRLPGLAWLPSDLDDAMLASAAGWSEAAGAPNLLPPRRLDVTAADWPLDDVSDLVAILNVNMIHIAPWEACLGLLAGAGRHLPSGGVLYLYGPYSRGGVHTAPSNARFDASLRAQDPDWGVRDLDDVTAAAAERNLVLDRVVEMPANNLSVVYRRVTDA